MLRAIRCCFLLLGLTCATARGEFTVQRVLAGLNQPTYMTQAPNSNNTLYIVERMDSNGAVGRVLAYDQLTGAKDTFLDLDGSIISDGGLLSLTFHPGFGSTNNTFYTVSNVNVGGNGSNRLDEWEVVNGVPVFQRRLLEYANLENVFHTMNVALFRPGGNNNQLFVVTGDGGTQAEQPAFDPDLIESPNSPYGKLLRIDLSQPFNTPANDPTHPGVDVVALGLRNPYRATFDRQTGDLYIADVGFESVEEVNFIPSVQLATLPSTPLDFGWTDREGTIATRDNGQPIGGPKGPNDIDPIFEYAHNSAVENQFAHESVLFGQSITGGYVYRGPAAEFQGRYFFADFLAASVHSGVFDTDTPVSNYNGDNLADIQKNDADFESLVPGGADIRNVTSFGEDNVGNLYIVKFGNRFFPDPGEGELFRLVADPLEVTVNRDTGAITLENNNSNDVNITKLAISSESGAVGYSSLTGIAGNYDSVGNMQVDDEPWIATTETGDLYLEATTGDAGTIASSTTLSLAASGGWVRSPFEDLRVSVELSDGSISTAVLNYVGDPIQLGDFDADGHISRLDFALLAENAYTDLGVTSAAESHSLGDMNGDLKTDYVDFLLFRDVFIAAHGAAAFNQLSLAPEPGSLGLLVAGALATAVVRRGRCPLAASPTG
jgi:Glucose / Sorbosone dehydrogenase